MWLTLPAGAALFVVTLIGNFAGVVILPFDMHHVFGQLAGLALIFWGQPLAVTAPGRPVGGWRCGPGLCRRGLQGQFVPADPSAGLVHQVRPRAGDLQQAECD